MTYEEYILNKIEWTKSIEEYWERMDEVGLLDQSKERWDKEYRFYEKFQEGKGQWVNPKIEDFVFKVFDWSEYFIKDVEKLQIVFGEETVSLIFDGNEIKIGDKMCLNGDCKIPNPEVLIDSLFKIYGSRK